MQVFHVLRVGDDVLEITDVTANSHEDALYRYLDELDTESQEPLLNVREEFRVWDSLHPGDTKTFEVTAEAEVNFYLDEVE